VFFKSSDGSFSGAAALQRWQWGGTNWYSTSLALKKRFKAADASLLRV
jgi:hypothetical protein